MIRNSMFGYNRHSRASFSNNDENLQVATVALRAHYGNAMVSNVMGVRDLIRGHSIAY